MGGETALLGGFGRNKRTGLVETWVATDEPGKAPKEWAGRLDELA